MLANPFVLTYDGVTGGVPDWVDHAPGGVAPNDPSFGADYVVGSCVADPPPADPGTPTPDPGTPPADHHRRCSCRRPLAARRRPRGRQRARRARRAAASPSASPAARRKTRVDRVTTAADGTFRARAPGTGVDAPAGRGRGHPLAGAAVVVALEGAHHVRRLASGITLVSGTTRPALPRPRPLAADHGRRTVPHACRQRRRVHLSASPIRLRVATRSSSSRPALAPNGPHRTWESSDELQLACARLAAVAAAGPAGRRRRPSRRLHRDPEGRPGPGVVYPNAGGLTDRIQYAVANDGYALGFTETTGSGTQFGMINYKVLPGTYRAT